MKKLILCALAGAVTMHIWSMVSWMALPWHWIDMKEFSNNGQTVTEAIKAEAVNGPGFYLIPNMNTTDHSEESQSAWAAGVEQGPYAYMNIIPAGFKHNIGKMMGMGFLIYLVTSFIIVYLIIKSSAMCAISRAKIGGMVMAAGAISGNMAAWNWWKFPLGSSVVMIIDSIIAGILVGLVISKIYDKLNKKAA